jgi:cold shock CspA family protein
VEATVIWFNAEKALASSTGDGSSDAFLHVGVLEKAGHDIVAPETKLDPGGLGAEGSEQDDIAGFASDVLNAVRKRFVTPSAA